MTKRFRADLSLAFCSLLWGATFVLLSTPSTILRSPFSLPRASRWPHLLWPRSARASFARLKGKKLLAGAALGFFMFAGYAFQTAGLQYTTPASPDLSPAPASSWFRCSLASSGTPPHRLGVWAAYSPPSSASICLRFRPRAFRISIAVTS